MKIEIYNQERRKPEDKVLLKLVPGPRETVQLVAVDEDGQRRSCGYILRIGPEGVQLETGVNPKFGLPLNGEGQVKLVNS